MANDIWQVARVADTDSGGIKAEKPYQLNVILLKEGFASVLQLELPQSPSAVGVKSSQELPPVGTRPRT